MIGRRGRLIWAVSAFGGVVAGLTLAFAERTIPAPAHHLPFVLLLGLFALSDLAVVHVEIGSQSHTFTLVEIPLVLGLITERPTGLVLAWLVGGAAVLALFRHQTPIKIAYNLMSYALEAVVATLIFHALSNGHHLLAATTFAGVFAAALAASVMGMVTVNLVVTLAEGRQPNNEIIQHLTFGLVSTAVTTSTVMIGVVLEQTDAAALWLLALPIVGVYLSERMFTSQIREHRRLQFLRRSTELVAGLGTEESISSLLRQICHTFNCDVAALTYLPGDLPDSVVMSVFGPAGAERGVELVPRPELWDRWVELAPGREPQLIASHPQVHQLGELIGHPGLRQGMVVPLCGDLSVIGFLTVADRLSEVSPFSADDMQVLDTLERFVSIGLENGHLERSLQEARQLERQLVHRATHDPLTGLANRAMLVDHLEQAMAGRPEADGSQIACLFIDLDDFKNVNDTFGHATGDQLLVVTAQRLVGCLRDGDMAARVGGDELAVVARVGINAPAATEAEALGRRIVAAIGRPAAVGSATVSASASVGIFVAGPRERAADVLAAADEAMYSAKRTGKARVVVFEPDAADLADL